MLIIAPLPKLIRLYLVTDGTYSQVAIVSRHKTLLAAKISYAIKHNIAITRIKACFVD